jgi:hypothetical protein
MMASLMLGSSFRRSGNQAPLLALQDEDVKDVPAGVPSLHTY